MISIVSAATLALLACASSGIKVAQKVDLTPAREAIAQARAAGAAERARDMFAKAEDHLSKAEALVAPGADSSPSGTGVERTRRAEALAEIATVEAKCAAEIARATDPSAAQRATATSTAEAERLAARLKKAEEEQRRLEDRIALLQRDLEMTETEVIRTKARLKGTETKAEASSAIAEARILMHRLADDKGRAAALARCSELLAKAEELLRQENFGAAAFFALKAQETAVKAQDETAAPASDEAERPAPQKTYAVRGPLANVRIGPSTTATVLATVPKGTVLEALAVRGEWVKVKAGTLVGWVHRSLVE